MISSSGLIDHGCCGGSEIRRENRSDIRRELHLIQRTGHHRHPMLPCGDIHGKRRVPHSKAGMTAQLTVRLRAAETLYQKPAESRFGGGELVDGVHRSEDRVVRHLAIKRRHQPAETVFADDAVDICFGKFRHGGKCSTGVSTVCAAGHGWDAGGTRARRPCYTN